MVATVELYRLTVTTLLTLISVQTGDAEQSLFANETGSLNIPKLNLTDYTTTVGSFSPGQFNQLFVVGADFKTYTDAHSSYGTFMGWIAVLGGEISVVYDKRMPSDRVEGIKKGIITTGNETGAELITESDGDRIKLWENVTHVGVTIRDLQFDDSGRYECGDDLLKLRVIDKEKNPAVVETICVSHKFQFINCTFITNSRKAELVNWDVTFSLKSNRQCDNTKCVNIACSNLDVSTGFDGFDYVNCMINGFIFINHEYVFNVFGEGPYRRGNASIDLKLDGKVLSLKQPAVSDVIKVTSESIALNVSLHEEHQNYGYVYHYSTSIHGLRYEIAVVSKRARGEDEVRHFFVTKANSSWVNITGLLPDTEYNFAVRVQLNGTDIPSIWSEAELKIFRTSQATPSRSPEVSIYGFELLDSKQKTCSWAHRGVRLYWKHLSEEPGYGNGKIANYTIMQLQPTHKELAVALPYETSAKFCVGDEDGELNGLLASTVAGAGPKARFYIPTSDSVIKFRQCDIKAARHARHIEVRWTLFPQLYSFTVFWCEKDPAYVDRQVCKQNTTEWKDVGHVNSFNITDDIKFDRSVHLFGVSAHVSPTNSSGIVWAECLSYEFHDEELVAAEFEVEINGLEANVTVLERCMARSRSADSYNIHYCIVDSDSKCKKDETGVVSVKTCDRVASILLRKHSSRYAFWVESLAGGGRSKESYQVYKQTGSRQLLWYEIALIAVGCTIIIAAMSRASIYCYRHRSRAKNLKHPTLVAPVELKIETEMDTLTETSRESDEEAESSLSEENEPYFGTTNSFTPLLEDDGPDEEFKIPVVDPELYRNTSAAPNSITTGYGSMPEDSATTGGASGYEPYPIGGASNASLGYLPGGTSNSMSIGYRPSMPQDHNSKYTPNISGMSCATLPDDYLRCTQAPSIAPDSSMSANLFYNGDDPAQDENKIDLARFLSHSGMSALQNNKLSVDLPDLATDTQPSSPYRTLPSTIPEENDKNKQLTVDVQPQQTDDSPSLGAPVVGQHQEMEVRSRPQAPPTDLSRYTADYVTTPQYPAGVLNASYQDNVSSCPVALDEILEQSEMYSDTEEIPENSSGDSGYVGRNNVPKTPINSGNQEQENCSSENVLA